VILLITRTLDIKSGKVSLGTTRVKCSKQGIRPCTVLGQLVLG
jgi:hypothetical protein